jgi:hypothetical protein
MKTVSNKTQRPVSVPLPRGKTLHLGPGKTGHISSKAVEYPQLKNLVDASGLVGRRRPKLSSGAQFRRSGFFRADRERTADRV